MSEQSKVEDGSVHKGVDEVVGRIDRVIFHDDVSNFRIYAAIGKDRKKFSITGISEEPLTFGDEFIAYGEWTDYKGRPSFRAKAMAQRVRRETRGIASWLRAKQISGVGARTVEKLIEHFKSNLQEVIDRPEKMVEAGISQEKAEAIAGAWEENTAMAELMSFLGQLDLGPKTIAKIIDVYGQATRQVIEEQPWRLARDIDGVGFSKADAIALSIGKSLDSDERVEAGLLHVLRERTTRNGHCGITAKALTNFTSTLLRLPKERVRETLEALLSDSLSGLVEDEEIGLVYPLDLHRAETLLAEQLRRRMRLGSPIELSRHEIQDIVSKASNELDIRLDEHQRQAVIESLSHGTAIVTGGPGTGKSTIMRVLAHALSMLNRSIALCAPTGIASKRLAEATGRPAKTVHRLLVWDPKSRNFIHNHENTLQCDWLITDEYSMMGLKLSHQQLDAIPDHCGVTIVGDVDQLLSVDSGNVLSDLIASGTIPMTRLMKTHRTGKGSGIAFAAARINDGKMPLEGDKTSYNGFNLEFNPRPEDILRRTLDLILYELPMQGFDPMQDIQVLTAMRGGVLGIESINQTLKTLLNPYREGDRSIMLGDRGFTIGDRVMHLRNDYSKGVFNGERGVVSEIIQIPDPKDESKLLPGIRVDYGHVSATYTKGDIQQLDHAWAITVHKSQGSEAPAVIFLYAPEHRILLNRSIAYTALTRAKAKAWMIGTDTKLLQHMVSQTNDAKRYTGLAYRLNPNVALPHMQASQKVRAMPPVPKEESHDPFAFAAPSF